MKKIFLIPIFLFPVLTGIKAQDFHLSQFNAAPHYFTPAQTGVYFDDEKEKADYRIYSDYRSQWRAFGIKPYSTFYLAYDMPFKDQFGLGGYLISNRNGAGGVNTIQFMPSGAYRITKDENGEHQLAVGLQIGMIYTSFDPGRYTYEKQFSPGSATVFDETAWNGEYFVKTSRLKPDAAMGIFYKYKKSDWKAHPWLGYSVYHVGRPNRSFTTIEKDRLPMRWVYELGADYKINDQLNLKPAILYMLQAKAHDLTIGATGFYQLQENKYDLLFGLHYRAKDAFIIQAGMKYNQHVLAFSYDINTANVSDYTNGRGAFELSLKLTGIKGKPMFRPRF